MIEGIIGFFVGLFWLIVIIIVLAFIIRGGLVVIVQQQHAVIIEKVGKFNRIIGPGFHLKLPFVEKKAATISLRTAKNGFTIDAKTADNVTVGIAVSAQYHVDNIWGNRPQDSGVYRSFYMLEQPVEQMRDFIIDALRSAIPGYSLDEVFAKKDEIANDVNETVGERMREYGFVLVQTLITQIQLPEDVERSMNAINSAQRERTAAQDLAEADRIKRVTEAKAQAEAMEEAGKGIAKQRKAIADGIKESLDTIKESGVSPREANELFMFTQWSDMMGHFADSGVSSTVVLPNDFNSTASMFSQMLTAGEHEMHTPTPQQKPPQKTPMQPQTPQTFKKPPTMSKEFLGNTAHAIQDFRAKP